MNLLLSFKQKLSPFLASLKNLSSKKTLLLILFLTFLSITTAAVGDQHLKTIKPTLTNKVLGTSTANISLQQDALFLNNHKPLITHNNIVKPDLPDIDVLYIHRNPDINNNYDSQTKNSGWPTEGSIVTFVGHIKNSGLVDTGKFNYKWIINGEETLGTIDNISPGQEITVSQNWNWQRYGVPTITLNADYDNKITEITKANNIITDRIDALSIGFYVEQSVYDYFNQNQIKLAGKGSNSWEDWAQRQVSRWNDIFKKSIFPEFPYGVLDRVRLDEVVVVPDGSLPLSGTSPTNQPDPKDNSVDLTWGFPLRDVGKPGQTVLDDGFYGDKNGANTDTTDNGNTQYVNNFYIEYGVLHELSHKRNLTDEYKWNINAQSTDNEVSVLKNDGTPLVSAGTEVPYYCEGGLMGCSFPAHKADLYSKLDVYGLNKIAGQREGCPACSGDNWVFDLPKDNVLKVVDENNNPIIGARVDLYYSKPADPHLEGYKKIIDNTSDYSCTKTDINGVCDIKNNLFAHDTDPAVQQIEGITIAKVTTQNKTKEFFRWFYLPEAIIAFSQNPNQAIYEIKDTPPIIPTLVPSECQQKYGRCAAVQDSIKLGFLNKQNYGCNSTTEHETNYSCGDSSETCCVPNSIPTPTSNPFDQTTITLLPITNSNNYKSNYCINKVRYLRLYWTDQKSEQRKGGYYEVILSDFDQHAYPALISYTIPINNVQKDQYGDYFDLDLSKKITLSNCSFPYNADGCYKETVDISNPRNIQVVVNYFSSTSYDFGNYELLKTTCDCNSNPQCLPEEQIACNTIKGAYCVSSEIPTCKNNYMLTNNDCGGGYCCAPVSPTPVFSSSPGGLNANLIPKLTPPAALWSLKGILNILGIKF